MTLYLIKEGTNVRARALGISGVNFCPTRVGVTFYLIKEGTNVRARALGISGVNFCPGISFSDKREWG